MAEQAFSSWESSTVRVAAGAMRSGANVTPDRLRAAARASSTANARMRRESDTQFNGRKFVAQTQNAAKPRALVLFEYMVLIGTLGSVAYLLLCG